MLWLPSAIIGHTSVIPVCIYRNHKQSRWSMKIRSKGIH